MTNRSTERERDLEDEMMMMVVVMMMMAKWPQPGGRGDVDFMTVGPGFSPSSALCI